ncbi:hypothetical protein [Candidatus Uabimicrobium sp. HlEnr_7]|uniref:hypothetical protein n=1 Tax=Candidatus Uabimicrobium helgolandensis TaxID=3095367 RepID=UPI003558AEA6
MSKYTVSGKKVVWALVVGFLIMVPIIFISITDKDEQQQANGKIQKLISEQYALVKEQTNEYVKNKEYKLAISTWKKFLKKFSYRNDYKESIQLEIIELRKKVQPE